MSDPSVVRSNRKPLIVAGIVLGLGQAGFFDGIVIHQLLQWHHMFTNVKTDRTVAGLELNTLGDGLFHLFDYVLTLTGIGLLWRASQREDVSQSTSVFVGSLLMGAGLFDFFEGLIDHQLLGIHHVKPGPNEFAWDMGFLALGLGLFVSGWAIAQMSTPTTLATEAQSKPN
ncbi:MAG: DUF2243 domain-containing protein [Leptolyngbya foveolarum]|uniref:DUF2243 domain-containing protein n=1 Tax=Leptolyngbya foveolarum TaxID=47253 RepID=A0A2W4UPV4_9CYAN|nr:MAG: DUF2243 domain-containing protein [Leptolyngbya foveolarum]